MTPTPGKGRAWMTGFYEAARGERGVPWADDTDHREGGVLDDQLRRGDEGGVRADVLVGEVLRRALAVEVDQVEDVRQLDRDVGPDLSGFRLHRVRDPVGVVDGPGAQAGQPVAARPPR